MPDWLKQRRCWLYGASLTIVSLMVYTCAPLFIPNYYPCNLPSLESSIKGRTLSEVGTSGYFDDRCPAPIASEIEFERPYGTIRVHWWGSPHRLYMEGGSTEGGSLDFRGPRVEEFQANRPDSILAGYTHRITFSGRHYMDSESERVTLEVYGDGVLRESVDFRYVPIRCECPAPEGL